MSSDPVARARGEERLHELFQEFAHENGVEEARMFNGAGLRVSAGFFGFIDHLGGLIVKVPFGEVVRMVAAGEGEHVTMGTRTMKEWVRIPYPVDGDPRGWRAGLAVALEFVSGRTPSFGEG